MLLKYRVFLTSLSGHTALHCCVFLGSCAPAVSRGHRRPCLGEPGDALALQSIYLTRHARVYRSLSTGVTLDPPWRRDFVSCSLIFICLFLAVLGLCCCAWVFSSCREWELLSTCGVRASHRCVGLPSVLFLQSTWALGATGFHKLWCMSLAALRHVGPSSQTRN